jgi:hypothetical protein
VRTLAVPLSPCCHGLVPLLSLLPALRRDHDSPWQTAVLSQQMSSSRAGAVTLGVLVWGVPLYERPHLSCPSLLAPVAVLLVCPPPLPARRLSPLHVTKPFEGRGDI